MEYEAASYPMHKLTSLYVNVVKFKTKVITLCPCGLTEMIMIAACKIKMSGIMNNIAVKYHP